MRVERPFAAPYDIEITRVRAMGDDKAKANGNADWKPTPKQLAQRDEFAGRFAKLCEAKRRKAIEDAAVEVEAKVEQEIKADAKATDETKQDEPNGSFVVEGTRGEVGPQHVNVPIRP